MSYEEKITDFLRKHKDADDIYWDTEAERPYKAVYRTVNGRPRVHVVEYYLEGWERATLVPE